MRRREFIAGLGSAAAWPAMARGQQGERVRRIGMLMAGDDPGAKRRVSLFTQVLADLGSPLKFLEAARAFGTTHELLAASTMHACRLIAEPSRAGGRSWSKLKAIDTIALRTRPFVDSRGATPMMSSEVIREPGVEA